MSIPYYIVLCGAMLQWLRVRTQNAGVVSANPERVTIKNTIGRKAMGNHLIKFIFPEKLRDLPLQIEYATQSFLSYCTTLLHFPFSFLIFGG